VHDADSRRNELESLESLLTPLKKLVTLAIALELHVQIEFQRARRTEEIDLHRVIDNQIDRNERLNDLRVASGPWNRAPRRRVISRSIPQALQHLCAEPFSRRSCAAPIRAQSGCLLGTAKSCRFLVLPGPVVRRNTLRGPYRHRMFL